MLLAVTDAGQFPPDAVSEYKRGSIDGIRVTFYTHQVDKAVILAKQIADNGYKLFMQPMVTMD